MPRISAFAIALAFASAAVPASAGDDAYTTRIEPRAVYGATTTIEHGVRVTRPLPAERHTIINPGSLTPLNLGTHEYREHRDSSPYYGPRH